MSEAAGRSTHQAELPVSTVPEVDFVRVKIAGDSGDGIQLTGTRFAESAARFGNDIATFPDFPADIRAPSGTVYGVSAYSLNIGQTEVATFGDEADVLVALNPAALKKYLPHLKSNGLLVLDSASFNDRSLAKAGFDSNPQEDGTLSQCRVMPLDITGFTERALADSGMGTKETRRCKNMWTLGLILWLFERDVKDVAAWIKQKFAGKPEIASANILALNAGNAYGEAAEITPEISRYSIAPAALQPGEYRSVNGNEAMAYGLTAGAALANLPLFYGSYPITPASPLLHTFVKLKELGALSFQAEDEIAAVCSAIGASYAGHLGVTGSSGPGIALKTEGIGLAIATELPLVLVNVQRGGPSTGLPTKTEQSDLFQAVFGRNGDAPIPVLSVSHPGDCFDVAVEAVRIATQFMTPVMVLSDGYVANATEPWRLPDLEGEAYEPFPVKFAHDPVQYQPFNRDEETLARPWASPGTPDLMHRIGGLERQDGNGNISYDGDNHQLMTDLRAEKVMRIAKQIPDLEPEVGGKSGKLALVSWGSSWGPVRVATRRALLKGKSVSHIHLCHIWPLPSNIRELLSNYDHVVVPEMNNGQLATLLRSQTLLPIESECCVKGRPFLVREITSIINERVGG